MKALKNRFLGGDKMAQCPYLEEGKSQSYCRVYPLGLMIPAIFEQEHFCKSSSYKFCCWYQTKGGERNEVLKKLNGNWEMEVLNELLQKEVCLR